MRDWHAEERRRVGAAWDGVVARAGASLGHEGISAEAMHEGIGLGVGFIGSGGAEDGEGANDSGTQSLGSVARVPDCTAGGSLPASLNDALECAYGPQVRLANACSGFEQEQQQQQQQE
jgi:hypothetical protein